MAIHPAADLEVYTMRFQSTGKVLAKRMFLRYNGISQCSATAARGFQSTGSPQGQKEVPDFLGLAGVALRDNAAQGAVAVAPRTRLRLCNQQALLSKGHRHVSTLPSHL